MFKNLGNGCHFGSFGIGSKPVFGSETSQWKTGIENGFADSREPCEDSEPQCDVRNATHLVQETERIGVYLFGSEASQWKPDLSVDFQIHAKFACIWKPKTTQGKVTATGVSQMKANASLMASFPLRAYPKTLKSVQKSRQWVPFWQFWDRL